MDVVNEGLLMYLSREEKRKVAENVRTLLQERPGVWITPDVGTRDFMERILKADPSLRAILEQLTGITERNIETNTFADHTDMANFFAEVGFDLELCPHTSTLHDLSSPDALGITVDAAQKMLAGRNTAVLTPRP